MLSYSGLIELLRVYNVSLVPELLEDLCSCVGFPDNTNSDDFIILEAGSLKISRNLTLKSAEDLKDKLDLSLAVVKKHLPFLKHFHAYESSLFHQCMNKYLSSRDKPHSIEEFGKALRQTESTFKRLLDGSAHFKEIEECSVSLILADITNEFELIKTFFPNKSNSLNFIVDMLTLKSLLPIIKLADTVCQKFQLIACLQDQNFKDLLTLVDNLTDHGISNLQIQESSSKLQEAISCFGINSSPKDWKFPELLKVLVESNDFYDFLMDHKFLGKRGQLHFQQQFGLVNQQLQGEEYQEEILSYLSVAYQFISSLNVESFQDFIKLLNESNLSESFAELKNVNHEVESLRLWFSRIEVGEFSDNCHYPCFCRKTLCRAFLVIWTPFVQQECFISMLQ